MRYLFFSVFFFYGCLFLAACIPVTIRPEFDDKGLPKAIPVTNVGSQDLETGIFHPAFPVSSEPPAPPAKVPWEAFLQIALTIAGVGGLGGAGVAMRVASKAKTAIKLVAELADAQEATSDPETLVKNKRLSAQMQEAAGVKALIKKVRGK
jgi:hypothetical protein